MDQPVIKVVDLKRDFLIGGDSISALRGVNLEILAGEFVVIFGPSGCGKTTLLSLLAGLDEPTSGQVFVRGNDLYSFKQNQLAEYRRTKVGMVFQQFNLIPTLSASDNVAMPLLLNGEKRKIADKRAAELLKILEIGDRGKHKPSEMSGGQQQRVAIARALAANPWILLVDEPTGNLDVPTGNEIMQTLKMVNQKWGRTVVLVTHNPDFLKYGDRIIYMQDGAMVKEEKTKRTLDEPSDQNDLKYFVAKRGRGLSLFETLHLSMVHFFSKRLRTFLTTLGVALGVGSIVTLVSLGIGLQKITANQLASLDALVTINVSVSNDSLNKLDDSLVQKLSANNEIALVSPSVSVAAKSTLNNSTAQTMVQGINPAAFGFEGIILLAGEKFTDDSVVISKALAKNFDVSDYSSIIGKKIAVDLLIVPEDTSDLTKYSTVTLEKTISGVSSDELLSTVYAPLGELNSLTKSTNYSSIKVKVADRKNVAMVRDQIEEMGLSTTSVVDLINQVDRIFLITQIVLGVIGGVSLIVALIGIVNIMTISLLERTHEVGVMKAIGATSRDVRKIFEYEVLLFGLAGAFVGVFTAWLFGISINSLVAYLMSASGIPGNMEVFITPLYFALEMIVLTVLVSLLAGWYPARRAAKLSPMEALRYE